MNTSAAHDKYHGLVNLGATCYLNSVLQVLFMTKDFREAVQRLTNDNPDFIDGHLKDLFDDLLQRTAYTYKIMKTLQIDREYEQRDAAEYLERILRLTSPNAAEIFHGQLMNTTTCSGCRAQTTRDGPFWHLPLPLVDSCNGDYNVVEGLEEFFKTSDLNGENQMYCDHCDTKVDAKRKNEVKHYPDVLIILLKRFDFSYQYMSFVKINCDVAVPYTIKIPENQKYELYAVVDHFGDLRSGHYVAEIKVQDDEDKWYCFDDTSVTQIVDLPLLDNRNSVKSSSAYLLFYRKKDAGVQETMVPTNGSFPASTCENYNQSYDGVKVRTDEHEHTDVSVDTVASVLCHSTVLTDTISVSNEKEMTSDHNFKAHHPEVKPELFERDFPESRVGVQESDEGNTMRDDLKGQAEHSSLLPKEAQLKVQDPKETEPVKFGEMRPDVNQDFPLVCERSVVEAVPDKQEEMSNAQRKEPGEETDEIKGTEKLLNTEAGQHHDNESVFAGQNLRECHRGNQSDGDDVLKSADVDKEGNEGRMETDEDETEGRSDSDHVKTQERLLTKYDLYVQTYKHDHKKQNVPDDQTHKQENQERNENRAHTRGKDYDDEQNKSGQRNSVAHEMESAEGVKKHNKNPGDEETAETSQMQSGSEIEEKLTWSQGAGDHVTTSLSPAVSCMKLTESSLLKDQNCRSKGVTDEQTETAGIKHILKNRSFKRSKSEQPGRATEKGKDKIRGKLGVFLPQKGRRTRVRIQRQIKRKSSLVSNKWCISLL